MKKTYQRLPESELDIMLVLWNGTPPKTRPEIEKAINMSDLGINPTNDGKVIRLVFPEIMVTEPGPMRTEIFMKSK
mgnify:CR=1 FL=1